MEIIWQWSSLHQHDYISLGEVSGTVLGARDKKGLRHGLAPKELMIPGISERNEKTGAALIKVELALPT